MLTPIIKHTVCNFCYILIKTIKNNVVWLSEKANENVSDMSQAKMFTDKVMF